MQTWLRFAILALLLVANLAQAGTITRRIEVNGRARFYTLYVPEHLPDNTPSALVIAFHGGGGQGANMAQMTGFSGLAERENFLVAYPNGVDKHWSDGRQVKHPLPDDVDDVAFVSALLDDASKFHMLDARRIYAAGMSNGGIFAHYLALKLSDRIAAIGVVAGGIATPLKDNFHPAVPVSVIIIHGRKDPIVPFGGGPVLRTRGSIVSTETAVQLWRAVDDLRDAPKVQHKPAKTANDCAEDWQTWAGGRGGTGLAFVALDGGGHTWPGGKPYLPEAIVGKVCPELPATRAIWEFFKAHPKP